jgi:lauroyl/myristoyl acyltransferase
MPTQLKFKQRTQLLHCCDLDSKYGTYDVFFYATATRQKPEGALVTEYNQAFNAEVEAHPEDWMMDGVMRRLRRKGWRITRARNVAKVEY